MRFAAGPLRRALQDSGVRARNLGPVRFRSRKSGADCAPARSCRHVGCSMACALRRWVWSRVCGRGPGGGRSHCGASPSIRPTAWLPRLPLVSARRSRRRMSMISPCSRSTSGIGRSEREPACRGRPLARSLGDSAARNRGCSDRRPLAWSLGDSATRNRGCSDRRPLVRPLGDSVARNRGWEVRGVQWSSVRPLPSTRVSRSSARVRNETTSPSTHISVRNVSPGYAGAVNRTCMVRIRPPS